MKNTFASEAHSRTRESTRIPARVVSRFFPSACYAFVASSFLSVQPTAHAANVISVNLGGASSSSIGRNEPGGEGQQAHNYALSDGVIPVSNWNFVHFGNNIFSSHGNSFPDAPVRDSNGANVGGGFNAYFFGNDASFGNVGRGPRTPADVNQTWVSGSILGNMGIAEVADRGVYASINNIPYAQYDLYVYVSAKPGGTPVAGTIGVTGQTTINYTPDLASMTAGIFDDATTDQVGNYVKFSNMTSSSIQISCRGGGNSAGRGGNFSGWQIVETTEDPYATWVASYGLTGGDALPQSDPDGDGLANGIEFVVGSSPTAPSPSPLAPEISTGNVTFTFSRATVSKYPNVSVVIEVSTVLTNPGGWPQIFTVPDLSGSNFTITPNGATEVVTLTVPIGADPAKFARMKVLVSQ